MDRDELPEDFWLSVRHICSFKNKAEYDDYIKKEIEKRQLKTS